MESDEVLYLLRLSDDETPLPIQKSNNNYPSFTTELDSSSSAPVVVVVVPSPASPVEQGVMEKKEEQEEDEDSIRKFTETLEKLCLMAEQLALLADQLYSIKLSLAQKSLTAELRLSEGDPRFMHATCGDIEGCLLSAYGRKPSPRDIGVAYFAVLIRCTSGKKMAVVSTALADFRPFPDNEFATRMEAVSSDWQRRGVAKDLFAFIEASVRFLLVADGFVRINTADPTSSSSGVAIKSCVDCDAPEWHTEMMLKFGYEEDDESWQQDDIEFSKTIH